MHLGQFANFQIMELNRFHLRNDKSWDNTTSDWTMKLGAEHDYDDADLGTGTVVFKPTKILIHEKYGSYII